VPGHRPCGHSGVPGASLLDSVTGVDQARRWHGVPVAAEHGDVGWVVACH
jgi:hypothetical protein